MRYKDHRLRHELKYIISVGDYFELRGRALALMRHDEHGDDGRYFVRSLYLDDIMLSDYSQKADGWNRRRKYRIRIYDLDDSLVKFEIKDKFDSCISKVSDVITCEECESIMAAQKDDRYYKEQADFVVDNSTDPEKLREMVAERLRKIL